MKIVIFRGGIGNQLFLYEYYMHLKSTSDNGVYAVYLGKEHNGFELCKYFDAQVVFFPLLHDCVKILHILNKKYNSKLVSSFFIEEEKTKKRWWWSFIHLGVWQDKKYMGNVNIHFKDLPLSDKNNSIKQEMLKSNSVTIHIRRGDYLSPAFCTWYWHLDETDYYQKAIEYVKRRFHTCSFFIFSDDIEWCKVNLPIENAYYIDWNKGKDSIYDMYLMSFAKVNTIANSTFSFWGAYLNKRSELTIYPLRWYKRTSFKNPDIFPVEWIGL